MGKPKGVGGKRAQRGRVTVAKERTEISDLEKGQYVGLIEKHYGGTPPHFLARIDDKKTVKCVKHPGSGRFRLAPGAFVLLQMRQCDSLTRIDKVFDVVRLLDKNDIKILKRKGFVHIKEQHLESIEDDIEFASDDEIKEVEHGDLSFVRNYELSDDDEFNEYINEREESSEEEELEDEFSEEEISKKEPEVKVHPIENAEDKDIEVFDENEFHDNVYINTPNGKVERDFKGDYDAFI